jgi:hypothetical protein
MVAACGRLGALADGRVTAWTDHEILLVRRNLAYHQQRSLRTVSNDAARAFLDEQQRRQNRLFGDCRRFYLRGTWCEAGENPWKTWPVVTYSR